MAFMLIETMAYSTYCGTDVKSILEYEYIGMLVNFSFGSNDVVSIGH